MTVKEAIQQLEQMPINAKVGSYNPVFAETSYLEGFELDAGFVQILFESETVSGHPFDE